MQPSDGGTHGQHDWNTVGWDLVGEGLNVGREECGGEDWVGAVSGGGERDVLNQVAAVMLDEGGQFCLVGVSAVVGVRFGGDDNTAGGGGVNGAVADLEDAVGKKTGAGNNRGE